MAFKHILFQVKRHLINIYPAKLDIQRMSLWRSFYESLPALCINFLEARFQQGGSAASALILW